MKRILITLFTLITGTTFSQTQDNFRFNFGISGVSIMNYGLKDVKNISYSGAETHPIYETETYVFGNTYFAIYYGSGFNFRAYNVSNVKYSL